MSERSACIALSPSLCYACREELERYFKHVDSECTRCLYHMQLVKLRCIAFAPWLPFILCSFLLSCKFGIPFHITLLDCCILLYAAVYPDCCCARVRITFLILSCVLYNNAQCDDFVQCISCRSTPVYIALMSWSLSSTCFVIMSFQSHLYCYSVWTLDPLHLRTSFLIATQLCQ